MKKLIYFLQISTFLLYVSSNENKSYESQKTVCWGFKGGDEKIWNWEEDFKYWQIDVRYPLNI